ncbi:MAG: hypothetical protein JWN44_4625 [Myxococcales bacterium]|nr:hypothetical protein [Myxococcales bacterium]
MNRGWARTLAVASLLPLAGSLGCDALTARSFAGTVLTFTASGIGITPPGMHLELWARNATDDIIRIDSFYDQTAYKTAYGLMVRQAISLDDPCMIDAEGNLLTTKDAYKETVTLPGGVTQTPEEQAKQVRDRINQLAPAGAAPLLAVLPYDPTPPPVIPAGATAKERLDACQAYEMNDKFYVSNPYQITAPPNGAVYGFVSYTTLSPPANYNGFRLDTPINLRGVQELFFTLEGANVDPLNRGPLFMTSTLDQGGRDVIHFSLLHADPAGTASGGVSLYVNIDEDSVQF